MEVRQTQLGESFPGLIESLWRYRWVVVLSTVVVAVAAGGLSYLQPVRYEATARLFLDDPANAGVFDEVGTGDPARYIQNQAELLTARPVAVRASELMAERLTPKEVLESVEGASSTGFDTVTIVAVDSTAEGAAELANAVGQAYQDVVAEEVEGKAEEAISRLEENAERLRQSIHEAESRFGEGGNAALEAERDSAIAQLVNIEQRANQVAVDASLFGSGIRLFEEAEIPASPVQPQPLRNAVVGGLLGLGPAVAFAYWRAGHCQRADDRHVPARILMAPLLGEVPDFQAIGVRGTLPARDAPQSLAVDAYDFIATSLALNLEPTAARSFLLTSPLPGDGKTTTALNLAFAAQRDGRSLLLVDADERVRGLSRLTGLETERGLTDLGDWSLPTTWSIGQFSIGNGRSISVVPAGTKRDDAASFFRTRYFRRAMERIKERAEMVIIDSPPLLAVSDTSAIASHVDGIVLVVNRGTPLSVLLECRERLQFVGTPLLGYVFNRASPKRGRSGAYKYGYGDAPSNGKEPKAWQAHVRRERHLDVEPMPGLLPETQSFGGEVSGERRREGP